MSSDCVQPCGGLTHNAVAARGGALAMPLGTCATGAGFGRRVTVLGVESSCDDTGVAVLQVGGGMAPTLLAHEVATSWGHHAHQPDIDKEHAAAVHRQTVGPLAERVIASSGIGWDAIDGIAVTVGPGMMGGLMAGVDEAVRLSTLHNKPLVPVNHLEGHALAAGVYARKLCFPFLVLLASGGSCQLVLARNLGDYRLLGQTLDCAPGQALDAVARALALDLDAAGSGGRAIELASQSAWEDTRTTIDLGGDVWPDGCDFSFVDLRDRAVALGHKSPPDEVNNIAKAVQTLVIDQLVSRALRAIQWCRTHVVDPTALVVAGGVGANACLRKSLQRAIGSVDLVCPPPWLCTDNGAMIAHAGALHYLCRPDAFAARPIHLLIEHERHLGEDVSECVKADRPMPQPTVHASIKSDMGGAARALHQGGLVAFPTETVYGLGADAASDEAVRRIFEVKGRPSNNPVIVHVASKEQFYRIAGREGLDAVLHQRCERLMDAFWPGPLTLLVPNGGEKLSSLVTCGLPTVGLRMPDNATAIELIQRAGVGVAAPSANKSGRPSPTCALHVATDLVGEDIWGVLDGGGSTYGIESTVLDVATLSIYREGPITAEDISRALDGIPIDVSSGRKALSAGETPKAPGMLYRHYAPDTDVTVVHGTVGFLNATVRSMRARGIRVGVIAPYGDAIDARASKVWYCMHKGDGDAMGSLGANLYAALRGLDLPDVDVILVRAVPESRCGGAIMERLSKASRGSSLVEPTMTARLERMVGSDVAQRIARGRVLVCGLGGAGAPLVDMAIRAGIGCIGLLDSDRVELSNLIRMPQATLADVDRRKIDVVAERAQAVNPNVDLTLLPYRITSDFDMGLLRAHEYDLIVDAVDDPTGKVALIKYAVENGIALISCMGAGNKTDVTQAHRVMDIADIGVCLLGSEVKRLLAQQGITHGVQCAVTAADHWIFAPEDGRDVIGNWPPCYFMASAALLDHVLRVLAGPESIEDRVQRRAIGVSTRHGATLLPPK